MAHVVVGLGNPGPEYRDTRHNIGHRVVDALAAQLKKAFHLEAGAHVARASWRGESLYLAKPQTFMNLSGRAVRRLLQSLGAGPEDLVLVYDDIDMELGKVRTRLKGSAGGHNGVQSVLDALGTEGVRRVKIGIGRPAHRAHVPDHVLTGFEPDEEETVAAAVATAAARVLELVAKS
ncbi:MAG TPA: aminoacyl-tRNA hydrolase [Methylomirabilota bacterium]